MFDTAFVANGYCRLPSCVSVQTRIIRSKPRECSVDFLKIDSGASCQTNELTCLSFDEKRLHGRCISEGSRSYWLGLASEAHVSQRRGLRPSSSRQLDKPFNVDNARRSVLFVHSVLVSNNLHVEQRESKGLSEIDKGSSSCALGCNGVQITFIAWLLASLQETLQT